MLLLRELDCKCWTQRFCCEATDVKVNTTGVRICLLCFWLQTSLGKSCQHILKIDTIFEILHECLEGLSMKVAYIQSAILALSTQ